MNNTVDWKYELLLFLSVAMIVAALALAPSFVQYSNHVRPWIDDQSPTFLVALMVAWGAYPVAAIIAALYLTRTIMLAVRLHCERK